MFRSDVRAIHSDCDRSFEFSVLLFGQLSVRATVRGAVVG